MLRAAAGQCKSKTIDSLELVVVVDFDRGFRSGWRGRRESQRLLLPRQQCGFVGVGQPSLDTMLRAGQERCRGQCENATDSFHCGLPAKRVRMEYRELRAGMNSVFPSLPPKTSCSGRS